MKNVPVLTGWDIKFRSVPAYTKAEAITAVKQTPHFDCIILFQHGGNESVPTSIPVGEFVDYDDYTCQKRIS